MHPIHVPANAARISETPAVTTETLASPTIGGTTNTSLWRALMPAGSAGPSHMIDSEQIWMLQSGRAIFTGMSTTFEAQVGDTVIMPAGAERSVTALDNCEFLVCGSPTALATIPGKDSAPVTPPWVR